MENNSNQNFPLIQILPLEIAGIQINRLTWNHFRG